MDKAALRKAMVERRAAAISQADHSAAQTALGDILATTEGPVSFYWPIRTEIDPRPVMEVLARTRTVCLPLTHGREAPLTFRRWSSDAEMGEDGFRVPVPLHTETVVPRTLVVPMLAFDAAGHRLGYGAGHYDRTLAGLRVQEGILAVGFAFEAQRVENRLPTEPTDQPLDMIVTDQGVHRINL